MGSVKKVVKEACESGKYLIAITFVDPKTGILQHRLESYSFPIEDVAGSFVEMAKLAEKSQATTKKITNDPGDHKAN